jgi:hypothetical protein
MAISLAPEGGEGWDGGQRFDLLPLLPYPMTFMLPSSVLRRRLALGVLLLAALTVVGGLHHHEDLAGALQGGAAGASTERVASSHSPLSKAAHWHAGVRVKEDPCLACQGHRMAGLASDPCVGAPPSLLQFAVAIVTVTPGSVVLHSGGSRGPPSPL